MKSAKTLANLIEYAALILAKNTYCFYNLSRNTFIKDITPPNLLMLCVI